MSTFQITEKAQGWLILSLEPKDGISKYLTMQICTPAYPTGQQSVVEASGGILGRHERR